MSLPDETTGTVTIAEPAVRTKTLPGPIVIAGLGGSGTRVVADILTGAGVFLGRDFNEDSDNVWFTLLLKRPDWFRAHQDQREVIFETLRVFERAMLGRLERSRADLRILWNAARRMMREGHDPQRRNRGIRWSLVRLYKMLRAAPPDPRRWHAWGWKEPNSHIYLKDIIHLWPDVRYIHVIRHGLDMAFSRNQNQLHNWGWLWGIGADEMKANPAGTSLRFWNLANRSAIQEAQERLGERSMMVRLEDLCQSPAIEIPRLLEFAAVPWTSADVERLSRIPQMPSSSGRYRSKGLDAFAADDLAFLREFGYQI